MTKLALITGASSGIGEATARKLAALGYDLVLTARRAERLERLAAELRTAHGVEVQNLIFDVRDEKHEGNPDEWEVMIDTNIKGLLYVTRIISRRMIEAGRGHIVNLGSIAGTQPYENGAVYCASKHAVHAISQSMRSDLVAHGIKVSEVRPGMVETEFSVVRFHGDEERAKGVYKGVTPLTGSDIAEVIGWIVSQPAHVNIDDVLITPQQQANAYHTVRK